MIETMIYCYKKNKFQAMKLLILVSFVFGLVVCIPKVRVLINLPSEPGPTRRPTIYRSALAAPEKFTSKEEPQEKPGNKDLDNYSYVM